MERAGPMERAGLIVRADPIDGSCNAGRSTPTSRRIDSGTTEVVPAAVPASCSGRPAGWPMPGPNRCSTDDVRPNLAPVDERGRFAVGSGCGRAAPVPMTVLFARPNGMAVCSSCGRAALEPMVVPAVSLNGSVCCGIAPVALIVCVVGRSVAGDAVCWGVPRAVLIVCVVGRSVSGGAVCRGVAPVVLIVCVVGWSVSADRDGVAPVALMACAGGPIRVGGGWVWCGLAPIPLVVCPGRGPGPLPVVVAGARASAALRRRIRGLAPPAMIVGARWRETDAEPVAGDAAGAMIWNPVREWARPVTVAGSPTTTAGTGPSRRCRGG